MENYGGAGSGSGFNTVNWLLRLDRHLSIVEAGEIDDRKFCEQDQRAACGFEDARIFFWRGDWWYTASALAPNHPPYLVTMTINRLNGTEVAESHFIPSPSNQEMEKNWMPLVAGDELRLIYRVSPMQTMSWQKSGFAFEARSNDTRFSEWSGSSQCIPYRGKRLCVVHRHILVNGQRKYKHAFIEIDGDGISRISKPWYFDKSTIEFCSGLCLDGDDAILGYGFEDREARLLRVPLRYIEMLFDRSPGSRMKIRMLAFAGALRASFIHPRIADLMAPNQ